MPASYHGIAKHYGSTEGKATLRRAPKYDAVYDTQLMDVTDLRPRLMETEHDADNGHRMTETQTQ